MGTLHVVGVPAGDPEHLTLRARRILQEVAQIVAEDVAAARALLAHHDISTPLVEVSGTGVGWLQRGDLALIVAGWPGEAGRRLVQAAAGQGHQVAAVPGPALPITALILSGLPADAFVYLGELPLEAEARRRWLAPVSGEQRTLVALASPPLPEVLSGLHEVLGDRPLVVVPASSPESSTMWRGSLAAAAGERMPWPQDEIYALVIGGLQAEPERWDEQRLVAEIEARLAQGRRAKEISRQLEEASGWSRRQVYDLVVETSRRKK